MSQWRPVNSKVILTRWSLLRGAHVDHLYNYSAESSILFLFAQPFETGCELFIVFLCIDIYQFDVLHNLDRRSFDFIGMVRFSDQNGAL